jgi:ATP-dependent Lhr-like helicase
MVMPDEQDPLDGFHPATARWFRRALGQPTPAQAMGWPPIRAGENTLILAPTGSGKTLAAFLAGLDQLFREGLEGSLPKGVSLLYISPLKALNYDIERNLRHPLEGIAQEMRHMGLEPPEIRAAVRTGDTPSRERARMARKPPHILITTPESLNLILCSRAAAMLAGVRQVIVDEIHSLASNKRGAFLSILLERLEEQTGRSFSRVGLSATQRPLEEVARFLGGYDSRGRERPVRIVDAGARKKLDIAVDTAVPDFRTMETGELWPSLERKLLREVERRRSSIIFANTRGAVERLSRELNEMAGERLVEPHHGSISATRRRETEERLKRGDLRAVVATASLELGIDMGAVELVCQVGSPKSVSAGLQRVGRAGHLAGAESVGRIFATSPVDLLESSILAAGMLQGEVEPTRIVGSPLDVLAQQIAAMCVHGPVAVEDIFNTVRRSACFHNLSSEAFHRTLEMAAGRMGHGLPARVSLDRVNGRVLPLPGTLRAVVAGGGVIPDTGQFPVYLSGTRTSIGELDEEFVFEAREGDAFRLGVSTWRIEKIEADRIFVRPSPGSPAKAPFWRGEHVSRPPATGEAIGRFLEEAEKLEGLEEIRDFVQQRTPCTPDAARSLAEFIFRQREKGALPTHRRIVVEFYCDAIGEGRMVVITPYGSRVHQALRIALTGLMQDETGAAPESMAGDEGVLLRLPAEDRCSAAILRKLTPERFRELLRRGLMSSPLFGLRFRQNAARALLMPPRQPGRRSPLWLQRLKAKDVLQMVRGIPNFPVVLETMRECLEEHMDAALTERILAGLQSGEVELREVHSAAPSPFASALEFQLQMEFMYVWDRPVGTAALEGGPTGHLPTPATTGRAPDTRALERLREETQALSSRSRARTAAELAETLRRLGDLTAAEAAERSAGGDLSLLQVLIAAGTVATVEICGEERFVLAEEAAQWREAVRDPGAGEGFWNRAVARYIAASPGCRPEEFAARYGLKQAFARSRFEEARRAGLALEAESRWMTPEALEAALRMSRGIRRREARPVPLESFQQFVLEWQHAVPGARLHGREGTLEILEQLAGCCLPARLWEPEVLARRVEDYHPEWLDWLLGAGIVLWRGVPGTGRPGDLALLPRGLERLPLTGREPAAPPDASFEASVLASLRERGASFLVDLGLVLRTDTRKIEKALMELAWAGLVTHDTFAPVRGNQPAPDIRQEAQRAHGSPRHRYQQLKRLRPPLKLAAPGRWQALDSSPAILDEDTIELLARLLLERYGVAARDIAHQAGIPAPWGSLYRALERMELAGEIERGYFVQDLGGAQFALPEAAQALKGTSPDDAAVLLNTCDPALVTTLPCARRPGNYVVLLKGKPALVLESAAKRLLPAGPEAGALKCLPALRHILASPWPLRPLRRLEVILWGEAEIHAHPVESALRSHGFQRTPRGMVLEAG